MYWQLAYTDNFSLDCRKTDHARFNFPGRLYLPDPGTVYLSYPPLVDTPSSWNTNYIWDTSERYDLKRGEEEKTSKFVDSKEKMQDFPKRHADGFSIMHREWLLYLIFAILLKHRMAFKEIMFFSHAFLGASASSYQKWWRNMHQLCRLLRDYRTKARKTYEPILFSLRMRRLCVR